ncbi:MAG: T9SS C-terminal target domain-containing protein [Calditrichaeota bacterium]|nr:MAG: T9SS C-terminal target domain-containing protein [Calditrichota bacterium]
MGKFTLKLSVLFVLFYNLSFAQNQTTSSERPSTLAELLSLNDAPIKCGLPAFAHLLHINKDRKDEILAQTSRSTLPHSYVTPSGRFRLHYTLTGVNKIPAEITNNAGVPDWVYEAGLAAEHAHALLVDTLGFSPPPADNNIDGPEYDIYFKNLSLYYGLTYPDEIGGKAHPYLEVENDFSEGFFTEGLDAVRVTVAHEYFHAVHFAYAIRLDEFDEIFFYEMSSTWFEDRAYDEINDYYGYLSYFFNNPELPPFELPERVSPVDTRIYAIAIFFKYWFKNRDDIGLTRMWDNFRNMRGLEALETEINAQGKTFASALAEFYGWCLYTGFRAEPEKYFEEGGNYPMIKVIDTLQITQRSAVSAKTNALSAQYVKLNLTEGMVFTSIIENGPADGRIAVAGEKITGKLWDLSSGTSFKLGSSFNEGGALMAIVNGKIPQSQGQPYDTDDLRVVLNIKETDDDVTKFSLAPNPFKPGGAVETVAINYEAPNSGPVEIKIFSETGRLVWKKDTSNLFVETWSGRDLDGNFVPSGVYFVVVPEKNKNGSKVLKLAVVR